LRVQSHYFSLINFSNARCSNYFILVNAHNSLNFILEGELSLHNFIGPFFAFSCKVNSVLVDVHLQRKCFSGMEGSSLYFIKNFFCSECKVRDLFFGLKEEKFNVFEAEKVASVDVSREAVRVIELEVDPFLNA